MAELPPKPRKPDLDECCGSGCDPCVFDVYHDAVDAWKRACREIEARAKADAEASARASAEANVKANAKANGNAGAVAGTDATPETAPAGTPRDPTSGRGA